MPINRQDLQRHHVIDLKDGKFSGTTPEDMTAMFQRIEKDADGRNLVIHFHGGLVSRRKALTAAADLYETYRAGGAYPVFVVWNSDLYNTIIGNLGEIAKERAFQRLLFKLAQFLIGKIDERPGARGRLRLPPAREVPEDPEGIRKFLDERSGQPFPNLALSKGQASQLERELSRDPGLRAETRAIMEAYRSDGEQDENVREYRRSRGATASRTSTKTLMSRKVLRKIAKDAPRANARSGTLLVTLTKYGISITRAVLKRYRNERDHGLYTTIVEEILRALYIDNIGQIAWNLMKRDTADAFGGDPRTHAGTALVGQLKKLNKRGQRVTLIGHSTGAIFIGHLLEHADKELPAGRKFDVVQMAPACTFEFLHDRLRIYKRRVAGIRSFGLADERERGYWEIPAIYNASLLYLVSGLFEEAGADTPLVGMERHFDTSIYDGKDVKAVERYLKDRLWSVADRGAGRRTAAKKHGGFEREAKTKESQRHLLANGI